jgi:polyisoprenoid-binding protein YceI
MLARAPRLARPTAHRVLLSLLALLMVAPTVAPAPAVAAQDNVLLTIIPDLSEARYRAQEQLFGRPLPSEAVGRTRAISGELALGADGLFLAGASRVVVDLRTLRSDESRRDAYIQLNTLETSKFPTAELVPQQALGLPLPLPTDGQVSFQIVGDLTVHGVTRSTVWDVVANLSEPEVAGLAVTRVRMTDFGMTPPRAGPVVSIEDELAIELEFVAARAPIASLPSAADQ